MTTLAFPQLEPQVRAPSVWRENALLLAAFAFALLPGGIAVSLLLLLRLVWLGKTADALLGAILLTLANPVLFSVGGMSFGRWLILLLAFALAWPGARMRAGVASFWLACLGIYLIYSGAMVSSVPTLTLFKGGMLVVALCVLLNSRRIDWTGFVRRLDHFIPLYVLLSLPLLALPSIGRAVNQMGFQGLTNHPQALGILLALLSTWLFARLWSGRYTRLAWQGWAALLAMIVMIVETQARTALGGTMTGFALVWLIQLFAASRAPIRSTLLALTVAAGAGLIWTQTDIIQNVIYKERIGGQREDLSEGLASRTALIEVSAANFAASPLVGIGFGAPSIPEEAEYTYDPAFGLPISTPNEKGVWVSATLEELGLAGFAILTGLLLALAGYAYALRQPMAIALLLTVLIAALGENIIFSMGALGLVAWLLFFSLVRQEEN